ncbi:MAG: UvrB/UvrC motif-containing protein, partial [Chthoniobacterales bacterium]|nr:UvrB/UvrC motif-containing protein [Chthoniobacterales bacterium]
PYPDGRAVRKTLDILIRKFGLRSCKPAFPDETTYRHCHDDIIRNCSAPCVGKVTREEYVARVRQACEFLEGNSAELIAQLEKQMLAAAERHEFERAAQLRDLIADLRLTSQQMTRFTRKSLPASNDPQRDMEALQRALGLPRLPVVMECFDISNISSTHIVASMVRFRNGVPETSAYRRYRIRTVDHQDDFASMAEVVRRRYSRVLGEGRQILMEGAEGYADDSQESVVEQMERAARMQDEKQPMNAPVRLPDLIVVDGGRGQLSAACRELQKLGLYEIPIIGLAKEFEEIYRPGEAVPLRLPEDNGALRLLQRLRDEAHRFANSYHALLLKKRMRESLLDTIPGISAARKKALLRKFGAVERIRKATAKEIVEAVPGLGMEGAKELLRRLNRGMGSNDSADGKQTEVEP